MCMGLKKCFSIIYQACSQENADENCFLKFHPQCAVTADFWPRVKSTAAAETIPAPHFKLLGFVCRAKIIIFARSIKFLGGRSAPNGCNLDYASIHEIPASGLF